MTNPDAGRALKGRLRADLSSALRGRASAEAALLRALIAAIDNAEAPPLAAGRRSTDWHVFHSGAAEAARWALGDDALRVLLGAEIAEREAAAAQFMAAGRIDHARLLLDEIEIVRRYTAPADR